jgi:antitoxin FitA
MQIGSIGAMNTKALQIRDVPDEAINVIRARAAIEGLSLTAYLRRMVVEIAAQPTVAEVLARASRRSAGLSMSDFVEVTRAGRDE